MSRPKWTKEYLREMIAKSAGPRMSDLARAAGVSRQRIFSVLKSIGGSIVDGKLVYDKKR